MRSKHILIGLTGILLGSALAASITIRDGLGRQVTVNAPVKRVVALSLTATEVMLDVGVNPIGSLQPCKSFPWLSCVFDCVGWLPFAVVCVFPLVS